MQIIDITESEYTESQGLSSKGKRVKAWYERNSDGKVFLYKEPKRFKDFITFEIWTEIIAYYIGKTIGLAVPEAFPAKENDNYGVLIENFLSKNGDEVLLETKDLLRGTNIEPYHNIALIEVFLTTFGLRQNKSNWIEYIKMLVFDCLIGNNDRHDENWGLCLKIKESKVVEVKFSPIYDNASCLTRELSEKSVEEMLNNPEKFEKYISGKYSRPPNLFWDEKDTKKYNHFEFMVKLIGKEQQTKQIIQEFVKIDYISVVENIIKEIQSLDLPDEHKLSDNRAKLIIDILEKRKQKLQELL